jgi:uncharacterized protein (TIGR02147 family)
MKNRQNNIETINIFKYLDYRRLLQDLYTEKKRTVRGFSYRSFCRRAGIVNPSFLKLVMEGKRNLTPSSIRKFSKGFGLKKQESDFFEQMVLFNQSSTHEEKNHYYKKLASSKRYIEVKHIERDQYEYFSKWYYATIRECICLPGFKNDPERIANSLNPKISPREAAEAIELLLKLELVGLKEDGTLFQKDRNIVTPSEAASLAVCNFQREMMKKAMEATERMRAHHREISTLTIAISKDKFEHAKKRIKEFRRELHAMLSECESPDAVYQLNFQLFPLSEVESEA